MTEKIEIRFEVSKLCGVLAETLDVMAFYIPSLDKKEVKVILDRLEFLAKCAKASYENLEF